MRIIISILILILTSAGVIAQKDYGPPAYVSDYEELYSTYSWESADSMALIADLGEDLATAAIQGSYESSWPEGISTLDNRNLNRHMMSLYKVYRLSDLDNGITMLIAPVADNRGVPENMRSSKDLFFIVSSSVVYGGAITGPPVYDVTPEGGFAEQMEMITQDFSTGFVNMTGAAIEEDDEAMIYTYTSRVALEGAYDSYFYEDLMMGITSYNASFAGSTDMSDALQKYTNLVQKVASLQLSACDFERQEELIEGNRRRQLFIAYDPEGLNLDYYGLTIEVALEQGEVFDSVGNLISNWFPALYIYEY